MKKPNLQETKSARVKSHDVQRICNDGQADAGHHPGTG